MKNINILFLILICLVFIMGCSSTNSGVVHNGQNSTKLQIITSFRPFTLLVAPVAGNYAKITQILPPGANPHDYEPTPSDAIAFQNAKIFFYDGSFLEPWANSLASSGNPNMQLVSFADAVPKEEFERMKNRYPNFPKADQDPHLWLSPKLAEYFVSYAAQKLSYADPAHAAEYSANANIFETRLVQLDRDYEKALSNCSTRTFLTSHAFLNYVAAAYNLTVISIAGLSPDAEPSIAQMNAVLNESKKDNVKGVLSEPDETQTISNSIAVELNLPVYPFSTMEILPAVSAADANDYISVQEKNLQEMRLALGCH